MRVVALTFHDVAAEAGDTAPKGERFYQIQAGDMENLLTQLRKKGYRTVSSRSFRAWQQGKGVLPERSVVFTFDDGYASHYEVVVPLLIRYRYTGTFFVTTDFVGRNGYATWEQLRKMVFLGMEIGSHGRRHVSLTSTGDLVTEVADSRTILEKVIGQEITGFCYPYGHLDALAVDAVHAAGYQYGCAIWRSPLTGLLALPRIYIGDRDASARLLAKWYRYRYQLR